MILRPSKFLRKWINFELRFGEDMILDKTKKQIKREFDKKWNSLNKLDLENFLKEKENKTIIWDIDKYKNKYYKSENFYKEFNTWKTKKQRLKKLERDFYNHLDRIEKDFRKNPFSDKLDETDLFSEKKYVYTFEDGSKTTINVKKNIYGKYSSSSKMETTFEENGYKHGISLSGHDLCDKVVLLINLIYNNSRSRNKSTSSNSNKKRRYDLLKKTLLGYKNQLKKERSQGLDTTHTLNEISSLEDKIKKMKEKYSY